MLNLRTRAKVGAVLGAVLSLAVAGSTFAASTTAGISEGITIPASVSLVGVPATATFALKTAGSPAIYSYAASSPTWDFTTNNALGLTIQVSATALGPITPDQRSTIGSATGTAGLSSTVAYSMPLGSISTTPATLASSNQGGSWSLTEESDIQVAATVAASTYTGTFTVSVATN